MLVSWGCCHTLAGLGQFLLPQSVGHMYEIGGSARRVPSGGPEGGPVLCPCPASFWWLLAIPWVIGAALQSCLCPGAFSLSQFPSYRDVSHWIQV